VWYDISMQILEQTKKPHSSPSNILGVYGKSIAGNETCVEIPSLDIGFDIGICTETSVHLKNIAISHGHMDHIGAIILHACRRQLLNLSPPKYYMPEQICESVETMFTAAARIDGDPIAYTLVPMIAGDTKSLSSAHSIQAFRTVHRVPSLGYKIISTRKRLKAEFKNTPKTEFSKLVNSGVDINESYQYSPVAYTGDTRFEIFDMYQDILADVNTLITELTFVNNSITVEEARNRGHIHLAEIVNSQKLLPNPRVIFTHFSARHSLFDVRQACETTLEASFLERVGLL